MAITYQKFLKLNIDLADLSVMRSTTHHPYFCTPKGASIIGWAGVDGIHFCKIRGFGEMVFAVSPMNVPGEYVHPLAESFEDFLRLLLVCGDSAALEQAWQWDEAGFQQFLEENPITEAQRIILNQIEKQLHLKSMEQPWQYISALQSSFDYSKITFTEDYYDLDMNPDAPAVCPDAPAVKSKWKVTFGSSFGGRHSKERAGKEIVIGKEFTWADHEWHIPAVYFCSKGLVVDFCMKIEPEKIQAFMDKWDLNIENEAYKEFSKEEEMQLELENPLSFHFSPQIILNGKVLRTTHGSGRSFNPCLPEGYQNETEAELFADHYGMDKSYGWMFWRSHFPWDTKRKPEIKTLEIRMEQQKTPIPGIHFAADKPGDTIVFSHPVTGAEYTLTVQEYEKQEMDMDRIFQSDWVYPTHYHQMTYTVEPEMEKGMMTIQDCTDGDRPVMKKQEPDSFRPVATASIGIIGGADGPTSVFIAGRSAARINSVCSSLHFEPVEQVEWRMVFHEKQYEDETFRLI